MSKVNKKFDGVAFGDWVKQQRLAKGLTQEALAEQLGLSKSARGRISRIEMGSFKSPHARTIKKFAEFFGTTYVYLYGRLTNSYLATEPENKVTPAIIGSLESAFEKVAQDNEIPPSTLKADFIKAMSKDPKRVLFVLGDIISRSERQKTLDI